MKFEKPKWKESFVLICTKCAKNKNNLAQTENEKVPESFAEDLKNKIKFEMRDLGRATDVRVMTSGCLGTCPINQQSVAFVCAQKGEEKIMTSDFDQVEADLRSELKIIMPS